MLPQLRLAVLGGALLIGVHLLAEYGAFAMLRFATFTTAIFEQFQATFNGAAGSTLAARAGAAVPRAAWWPRRPRGATPGSPGSARERNAMSAPHQLGAMTIPAVAALGALAALALGVPVWTDRRWLWIGGAKVWDSATSCHHAGQTWRWPPWRR